LLAGDGFRGGVSPVLADPGRPGSVLDEIWSGRKLAACVTHLGGWHGSTAAETARLAAEAGRCGDASRCARVQAARA
jgi:hypothetical protein